MLFVLLLPMTWFAGTAPAATLRPETCWLLPARSSVPLVLVLPIVSAPAVGRALLTPTTIVPCWRKVPPV